MNEKINFSVEDEDSLRKLKEKGCYAERDNFNERDMIKFAEFHCARMKYALQTDCEFYAKQSLGLFLQGMEVEDSWRKDPLSDLPKWTFLIERLPTIEDSDNLGFVAVFDYEKKVHTYIEVKNIFFQENRESTKIFWMKLPSYR